MYIKRKGKNAKKQHHNGLLTFFVKYLNKAKVKAIKKLPYDQTPQVKLLLRFFIANNRNTLLIFLGGVGIAFLLIVRIALNKCFRYISFHIRKL